MRGLVVGLLVLAWTACAPAAPQPTPTPTPAPSGDPFADAPEKVTEGETSVSILSVPDHPAARPPPGAPPEQMTDAKCRARQPCGERGLCTAAGTECVAASWTDCEQMNGCGLGKCTFAEGKCVVVASCAESWPCRDQGRCAEVDGKCVAGDDAACKASGACQRDGLCSKGEYTCIASHDGDCKGAGVCQNEGRCTAEDGLCRAVNDGMCRRAPVCKDGERCVARDGVCVKSCAESDLCSKHGRCGEKKEGARSSCIALNDADCEKSALCADLGLCTRGVSRRCVAGDDVECLSSRACKEEGRCSISHERCVPGSDAECKQAVVACHREGRCRHADGLCVK